MMSSRLPCGCERSGARRGQCERSLLSRRRLAANSCNGDQGITRVVGGARVLRHDCRRHVAAELRIVARKTLVRSPAAGNGDGHVGEWRFPTGYLLTAGSAIPAD
jgi:hypothetical protein